VPLWSCWTVHLLQNLQCEQWRSQALKSGWAQKVRPPEGPGVEPWLGSGVKAPTNKTHTNNLQLSNAFSTQVCCRVRAPFPLPLKNCSDLRESYDPTRPGQGGHVGGHMYVPTRGYATECEYHIHQICVNSYTRNASLSSIRQTLNKIGPLKLFQHSKQQHCLIIRYRKQLLTWVTANEAVETLLGLQTRSRPLKATNATYLLVHI